MLRITQQSSADAAKQYYASSADYYLEGQEMLGRWGGKGAERLGLNGPVSGREFNRLCDNLHPRTGQPLTARTKDDRTVLYDFTWSVPKSVSILYAQTEDVRILNAFRESAHETMQDIEQEMKARVRKGGKNAERVTGNMIYGEFVHFTSRPVDGIPDPQLHIHAVGLNATWDNEENAWKAGQFRDIKRDAPYWQAAFRARLANRLQTLGFGIERKRDDFEIAGVPGTAIKRFSRRKNQIDEAAREQGITDPKENHLLGERLREGKAKNLTWKDLRAEWNARLTPQEREAVAAVAGRRGVNPAPEQKDAAAVDFAVRHLFARDSVVPEKRLLAAALQHGLGNVTVEGIRREYEKLPLLVEEHEGRRMVTTPQVLAEEDRLVAFAREGRGVCRPLGVPGRPIKRAWLNDDQRRAVEHILGSRDRVMVVRGAAGTGKTTLMQEAVEAIGEGGHRVVVLAPSAAASRDVLRREGFKDADTVAMFLRNKEMQREAVGQIIWVDEAGLLGSQDLAALFEVAQQVDARVVLMGDRQQHGSVARGSPLKLLEQNAGVPSVAVRQIIRQEHADYKKAVRLLSEGKTAEGFNELDRLGWIQEVPDQERYLRLAEAYVTASAEKKADGELKSVLVVSPTHAEAARITEVIRQELAAKKQLKDERELPVWVPLHLTEAERGERGSYAPGDMLQYHQNARGHKSGDRVIVDAAPPPLDQAARFAAYRPAAMKLAVGDRVRITANGKTAEGRHRLNNGALFTVKGFTPDGNIVADNDWVISKEFGHIAQGYVVTSHASQGKSVDTVLIGQSSMSLPAASREGFYVSASRGKQKAIIFTDNKKELRDAVARDGQRLTATEIFRKPKAPGRERLNRHMSFLRRLTNAVRPREQAVERLPMQEKEAVNER